MRPTRRLKIERLEVRTTMTAEGLDLNFGTAGVVQTDFAAQSNDQSSASALQADGKILMAGISQGAFAVARYTANGALDTSFSYDGKVLHAPNGIFHTPAMKAMALQSDGKIVLVGSVLETVSYRRYNQNVAIVRLHPNGLLDTSFSQDGFQYLDLGATAEEATALVIQPDGKIVVAANHTGQVPRAHLLRYLANGELDTSFSGDGISAMASNGSFIEDIARQPDGRILAGGFLQSGPNRNMLLTRFLVNGALDGGFGEHAKVVTNSPIGTVEKVKLLPDGRFYVAGSSMIVHRYFSNGQRDDSYSTLAGLANVPGDFGDRAVVAGMTSMIVRADGGLALLGVIDSGSTRRSYFVQLNPDGYLDEGFAGDGDWNTWTESIGKIDLNNILQRADGRLIVTGFISRTAANDFDFIMYGFKPTTITSVPAALALNSAGHIELFDRAAHDDRWQLSRTATEIVITDLSLDSRLKFTVNALPEVAGSGTKQLRIPLSLLQANGKALIISGRDGDDTFSIDSDLFDAPIAGISFRGGIGANALALTDYNIPISWIMSGPSKGSVRPQGRVPMTFMDIDRLSGGRDNDYFLLSYQGSSELLAIDGGVGGVDTFEIRADQDMSSAYFPWPYNADRFRVGTSVSQYYAVRNFERAVLTTGTSDNILSLPTLASQHVIVYAGSGNDQIMVSGPAIVFGQDGNDTIQNLGYDSSTLRGGNGDDLLIGGGGSDQLYGDAGRDILIGGFYIDLLVGGTGDDLLIGGNCPLIESPANPADRNALIETWRSGLDYATRVEYLSVRGVGPSRSLKLTVNSTVMNDLWFVDTFYGNAGQDWFFLSPEYELNIETAGLRDQALGEVVNNG